MKKNKECQIVEDLLIGYKDETLNPESKELVKNHLLNCDNCKNILKDIENDNIENNTKDVKELDHLKKINNKISHKNKLILTISIVLILIIILNIIVFINYRLQTCTIQIYLADNISVEELEDIENTIKSIDKNAQITFNSKENELNKMKNNLGENSNLLDYYNEENNIFPASYTIKSEFSKLKNIEYSIMSKSGVKSIINSIDENPYYMLLEKIIK